MSTNIVDMYRPDSVYHTSRTHLIPPDNSSRSLSLPAPQPLHWVPLRHQQRRSPLPEEWVRGIPQASAVPWNHESAATLVTQHAQRPRTYSLMTLRPYAHMTPQDCWLTSSGPASVPRPTWQEPSHHTPNGHGAIRPSQLHQGRPALPHEWTRPTLHNPMVASSHASSATQPARQDQGKSTSRLPIPFAHLAQPPLPPWKPAIPEEYIEAGSRIPKTTTRWQRLYLSFTDRKAATAIERSREIIFIEAGSTRTIPAPNTTVQLHHYLLEIITFKFGVDCKKLNEALKQETSGPTTSILGVQERFNLLSFSLTIQQLHSKTMKNEWKSMPSTTKKHVLHTVVGLAVGGGYHVFALDLLAS